MIGGVILAAGDAAPHGVPCDSVTIDGGVMWAYRAGHAGERVATYGYGDCGYADTLVWGCSAGQYTRVVMADDPADYARRLRAERISYVQARYAAILDALAYGSLASVSNCDPVPVCAVCGALQRTGRTDGERGVCYPCYRHIKRLAGV